MNCVWGGVDNYTWGEVDNYAWNNLTICQKTKAMFCNAYPHSYSVKLSNKNALTNMKTSSVRSSKAKKVLVSITSPICSFFESIPPPIMNALTKVGNCIKATWS